MTTARSKPQPKPESFLGLLAVVLSRPTSLLLILGAVAATTIRLSLPYRPGLGEALELLLLIAFSALTELVMHKFVLHGKNNLPWSRHHRLHHRTQMRLEWIFIPLQLEIVVLGGLFGLGALLTIGVHLPLWVSADMCAFVLWRILWQEVCHYAAHCPSYFKSGGFLREYFSAMTKRHQRHHTLNEEYDWEVSTVGWADYVYNLLQRPTHQLGGHSPPCSGTTTSLGVLSDDSGYIIANR